MKLIARSTQLLALVLFLSFAPETSSAGSVFGTLGIGGGSSPMWDEPSQGGIAVSGTATYRMRGPSVSARFVGIAALTPLFDAYEESVSEIAVLGGWDFLLPGSAAVALRLGLGRMSYYGGYSHAVTHDYEGNAWGPALQIDAFWKRIGFSYVVHTGDASFRAVMICVKLGNLSVD
jgi:hypothetical protein